MGEITIRPARVSEAEALSALCFRSKAHWGYDNAFMPLSRAALTISPTFIAGNRVLVAENCEGNLLGMASVARLPSARDFDLVHLFVEPSVIGSGAGRLLFLAAVTKAKEEGALCLVIQSDPNAADFYRSMGARDAGETPSEAVPGRMLPVLHFPL